MPQISGGNVFTKQVVPPSFSGALSIRSTNETFQNVGRVTKQRFGQLPKIIFLLFLHSFVLLSIFIHLEIFSAAEPAVLATIDMQEELGKKIEEQESQVKATEETIPTLAEITANNLAAEIEEKTEKAKQGDEKIATTKNAEAEEEARKEEKGKEEHFATGDDDDLLDEFLPVKEIAAEIENNPSSDIISDIPKKIEQLLSGSADLIFSSIFPFENNFLPNLFLDNKNEEESELYDYIVVGAGVAGCAISRTLADGKMKVLLIERGKERTQENSPYSMDAYGVGLGVADPSTSQLIGTPQGVRTHVAIGMGGGSGINVGMMINPPEDYFQFIQKQLPDIHWDTDLVQNSYAWVVNNTGSPAPPPDGYGEAYVRGLEQIGYKVYDSTNTTSAQNNNTYNNSSAYNRNNVHIPQPSPSIIPGYTWRSYSLFNSTDNFTRNAADVLVGGGKAHVKKPDTLTIKTQTTVQKIEFDTTSSIPKATCVLYRNTTLDDIAPLFLKKRSFFGFPYEISTFLNLLFHPLSALEDLWRSHYTRIVSQKGRACIKTDGQIILSAGAVLTPTLLFKSGVGPLDQIRELGVPLIKEVPKLGSDFSDRVLIPIGVFAKEDLPPNGFTPNAGQIVGIKQFGPDCTDYQLGKATLKCTSSVVENMSGGRMTEGIVMATRYIIPPQFRDDPIVDLAFNTFQKCAHSTSNDPNKHTTGICRLVESSVRCLRRAIANFYFTAEPKSRGYVKMRSDGQISVVPNYMQSPEDLFDAVRGVSNLVDIINSDVYKGLVQPLSDESCPFQIMTGLVDMILHFGSQITPYMLNQQGNFKDIIKHINELLPDKVQRNRRLLVNDEVVPANEENLRKINIPQDIQNVVLNKERNKKGEAKPCCMNNNAKNCHGNSISNNHYHNNSKIINHTNNSAYDRSDVNDEISKYNEKSGQIYRHLSAEEDELLHKNLTEMIETKSTLFSDCNDKCTPSKKQWAAAYPIGLPDSSDPLEVARFVLSYMTSVWHHTGTAQIGSVVDENLDVYGIDNLSIVDASVLPFVTPMNPTSTIMMLGRYSGVNKLRNRNIDVSEIIKS